MSADFLFSFLLFFQVQIESIKESGFYKMLLEKYPEESENILNPAEMEPEVRELFELTGLNFDDLAQFSLIVEGLDGISKASQEGRSPKIGTELDFFISAKLKGELDVMKMFSFILEKIEEEEGEDARKKVEKTISKNGNSTMLTLSSGMLDQTFSETELVLSISKNGKYSNFNVGLPTTLKSARLGIDENSSFACVRAMSKDRQITLAIKVDPSVWERPEFNSQQQNPLFAGLANSVKGIREFGLSVSFRQESLGLEICVSCKDTQSALGLWTVAQGGLGMAQLAMAQDSDQTPAILSRIKTQAVEKNVFVRVDINDKDLEELESMQIIPQNGGNVRDDAPLEKDPLINQKAPTIQSTFLNGNEFKLSNQKGKVVVIDFWATWCGPCIRALPVMMKKMSEYDEDDVILIAVNEGESRKVISQFLKKKKLHQLNVVMDRQQNIGSDYKVQGIPKTVVIDQEGIIRHVEVGFSGKTTARISEQISKLLDK